MPGPVALVGSGEYLPVMAPIDRHLLDDRPPRVVMLPTAAALEGDERLRYWADLGTDHFRSLGMEPIVLPVLTRDDACSEELASRVRGAGLVYLSGGSPAYLSETLRSSRVFEAIVEEWERGAALGGCSAGACALTAIAGGFRHPERLGAPGLGLFPHLAIIPHFDFFDARSPGLVPGVLERVPDSSTLFGVDERTALVGTAADGVTETFDVMGEQSVWWIDRGGDRHQFASGTRLTIRAGEDPEVLGHSPRSR